MTDEPDNPPDAPNSEAAGEETAPAADDSLGAAGEALAAGPVETSLARWLEKAAAQLSAALGKTLALSVKSAGAPDAQTLSTLAASSPIALKATAKRAKAEAALALFASEADALAAAKLTASEPAPEALDDAATAAFGDFARMLFSALSDVWLADGADGLTVDPAQPAKIELPGDDLPGEGATLAQVSVAPEGGGEFTLSLFFGGTLAATLSGPAEEDRAERIPETPNIDRILNISVPLVVEIARRRITLKEVIAFKPGTVIEFEKKSDDLLDLTVAKARIGKGEAVKVGESFGLRVLDVGSVRERIKSLSE